MPNIVDYLFHHARLDPTAPALRSARQEISYGRMAETVRRVAAALRREGVQAGQVVVVRVTSKEPAWLFCLALFHEAAIVCVTMGHRGVPAFPVDWVLLENPADVGGIPPGARKVVIDREWMQRATSQSPDIERVAYPSEDAPARIFLTSGTTGQPKGTPWSTRIMVERGITAVSIRGMGDTLSLMGFGTGADFSCAIGALVKGMPLHVANRPAEVVDLLRKAPVGALLAAPSQLGEVLRHVERAGERLRVRTVRTSGAALPRRLLMAVHKHLTRNVVTNYGSTEAGGVTLYYPTPDSDPDVVGYVVPDVDVQIVDDEGRALPHGEVGLVRIRTPRMAHAYWHNPEASAKAFRDGWFYPGDRGSLTAEGLLKLGGRSNDVINAGGVKVDPAVIDRVLDEYAGISDGAACTVRDQLGVEKLAVAVVAPADFDFTDLRTVLGDALPKAWRIAAHIVVQAIPRNDMGKVMRGELQGVAEAALAARQQTH